MELLLNYFLKCRLAIRVKIFQQTIIGCGGIMFNILLGMISGLLIGWLTAPFLTFIFMILLSPLAKIPRGIQFMQTVTYASANIIGITIGGLVLRSGGNLEQFGWLFVLPVLSTFSYITKGYSFATKSAADINFRQKTASILGLVIAFVISFLFVIPVL